ncbi:uncharacterized protein BKA55DRAFT_695308 [Fusarium redolens]|uniref:CFEM domain-containing protein n=1 Tax=Fusarium redolens TaxID=48865 RepID=A0A9P9JVD6_FUSRE|nr:uncharacterized protein BKA55DRAFT_695308 [Fusarium redolens]KAH7233790.1 hypothetical protein BKA55DRAFT_695308 [Fusarium redolens]
MKVLWPLFLWFSLLALPGIMATSSSAPAEMPDCASQCIATAIADSPCPSIDETCLCSNKAVQSKTAGCFMESCTVKEPLIATNLTRTRCGAPIHDGSRACVAQFITLTVISTLFIIERFSVKLFWGITIWLDDWSILISYLMSFAKMLLVVCGVVGHGLGRDIWTLSPSDITAFGIYIYASGLAYTAAITMLKLSLLFFYLRIFPAQLVRPILWGTVIFTALSGIAFCLTIAFQCRPISYFWNGWDGEHQGHCSDANATAWSYAALSIVIDIWMLIVPLSQLRSLNLSWKKKVGVGVMFCLGTFVTIISILRLRSLIKFALNIPNPTRDFVDVTIWSGIEMNVGIICACLPFLRFLLARLFPRILGPSQKYYSGQAGRDEAELSNIRSRVLGSHAQRVTYVETSSQRRNEAGGITIQRTYAVESGDNDEIHLVSARDLDQTSLRSDISL